MARVGWGWLTARKATTAMTTEMAAITTTPLQSPKLCDPTPEKAAAPIAITSSASTSSTRSTTTVALASPTPMPARGAMAPIRNSSPSLNGETAFKAKPMPVTDVASPRRALGADARRITSHRQPRTTMKARKAASAIRTQPRFAPRIAVATSAGWTVRNTP